MKQFHYKIVLLVLMLTGNLLAQDSKVIDVISDRLEIDEKKYPGATLLSKVENQVYLKHKGIEIWCDQAVHYGQDRFVKAYGNVQMKQGDTLTMNSKYAEYNGNTEFAYASTNVVLETEQNTLKTDTLFFDRLRQQAYYRSGGTVIDSSMTLTSRIGRYYMDRKFSTFTNDVVVVNNENTLNSDRLDYFNETGKVYLYGPSTVQSPESTLYCERGFYDTKTDIGYAIKNARIDYDNRRVLGDSIYVNNNINFASATNNIRVIDTANHSLIKGHYAEVFKNKDSVFITKRALAISKQENDSIFIHSDTIMVTGKPDKRLLRGFYDVRIFKTDMSGKCDSISVDQVTGFTKMIRKPILWSAKNQMTGDTIQLISNQKTNQLDSLKVYNNSFLVQQDTLKEGFNQVKGAILYGLFKENQLYQVDIDKNTETIYFQRDDKQEMIGINKVACSNIRILFEEQEMTDIYYYDNVEGTLYMEDELPPNARELQGLLWRGDELISSKKDLFRDEAPFQLTKIKGLPLPEEEKDFFDEETLKRINDQRSEYSRFKDVKLKEESGN
ncbi:OstA-like protein [Aquimarina agarilytica]|uniref:OstA-like protein n=1 Tax=Aquimarina agarilytica TaxID=1087449 RepID=UPI000492233B|nr:OstA-like protein [Aquimarina agarilytica]